MTTTASSIELNRVRSRPPPLSAVRFFTEEASSPPQNGPNDLPPSTSYEDEGDLIHPRWKRDLFMLLEQPTSSYPALVIHILTIFLIIFSALVTVLETVPAFHSISPNVWFGVETSIVALFTVEYVARAVAWSNTWSSLFTWAFSFFGVIDLLSVLPYYLELLLRQDTSVLFRFSILRMFRLLRVFRPFRYNNTILLTMEVMYLSVRRSQHALLAIGFFVFMILTIFSTLLYFAERGTWDELLGTFINADGDPTQFSSIPAAAWFVLVTITTVGYGEITPRSFLGRLITLPILVFGLLLITLPSFVLGREFSHVWEKMTSDRAGEGTGNPTDSPPYSPVYSARRPPDASSTTTANQRPPYSGSHNTPPYYTPAAPPRTPSRDLSNMKLAQNQTELSRQIEDLAMTVEIQGRMLEKLLERLETRDGTLRTSGRDAKGGGGGGGGYGVS